MGITGPPSPPVPSFLSPESSRFGLPGTSQSQLGSTTRTAGRLGGGSVSGRHRPRTPVRGSALLSAGVVNPSLHPPTVVPTGLGGSTVVTRHGWACCFSSTVRSKIPLSVGPSPVLATSPGSHRVPTLQFPATYPYVRETGDSDRTRIEGPFSILTQRGSVWVRISKLWSGAETNGPVLSFAGGGGRTIPSLHRFLLRDLSL